MSESEKVLDELKYTKEHEWIKIEEDIASVGITDYAQEALNDIVFVELPEIGKDVNKDKQFCVVESVKSVSEVFSPITGTITEVNKELSEKPELVNKEPYSNGWLAKIKVSDKTEIDSLMNSEEYKKFLQGLDQ